MTEQYKVGTWYGWNGGDCPVYSDADVRIRVRTAECNRDKVYRAGDLGWDEYNTVDGEKLCGIVAFCVVAENAPPLELWVDPEPLSNFETARFVSTTPVEGYLHMRQVLPEQVNYKKGGVA